jgi:hypothetical protein
MAFEFKGYDDEDRPIYEYVPDAPKGTIKPTEEPEPETIKFNPMDAASDLCIARGGTIDGTLCRFPSGTFCDLQELYNGTCPKPVLPTPVVFIVGTAFGIILAIVLSK